MPQLQKIFELSRFVQRSMLAMHRQATESERVDEFKALCRERWTREAMESRLEPAADSTDLGLKLRILRRDILLNLIGRNASGACGYDEVVEVMSDFAEVAVNRVVCVHSRELASRYGMPVNGDGEPQDLLVVGMGKLGGRELNVSSDIDLVFLYGDDGMTKASEGGRSISNEEFFTRLARRIIPALNDPEGPGFVFRVDMRLRPNGDSGPIVASSGMLEEYLYSQGRDWERFAWLKGRIVNGPVFAGEEAFARQCAEIRALVQPFVYRKYLDFDAISSLMKLHRLVRAETDRREHARAQDGANVKLGRGGIREIEFLVQTLQVIRGGRDVALRGRETLEMLPALLDAGALDAELVAALARDYRFLRNLEHALQYVDDAQTQWLPRSGDVLERAAGLLDLSPETLWSEFERVREEVARGFDSVFHVNEDKSETNEQSWPIGWASGTPDSKAALIEKLLELGYDDAADELAARILNLVGGRRALGSSEDARRRMRKLVQFVAQECPVWCREKGARLASSSEELSRYLRLLEAIQGRSTYVSLLYEYPKAAARVGRILSASRWCADYLTRHPIVLDELIDARMEEMNDYTPVDWSKWKDSLSRLLEASKDDQERQMNLLRDAHHAAIFRLVVADLDGRFSVERLADQLSALADAAVELALELAWNRLPGRPEGLPKFAVIGYGKLGGKELGYASDLDLVFLYDDDSPNADAVYSRLVRRMMSWLTLQTSSGKLFDIDLRLRPNGENGLIVSSFDMFSNYERNVGANGAWVWEHQALTRARFVAGDPSLGRRFEDERAAILSMPRNAEELRRSILEMRQRMLDGHPNRTVLFDVKHDRGGMVDVEFAVQYLVLAHANQHPELLNNFGNILLLEMCARIGLIGKETADDAVRAYRHYRLLQHEVRLNAGDGLPVRLEREGLETEIKAVRSLWHEVFEEPELLKQSRA